MGTRFYITAKKELTNPPLVPYNTVDARKWLNGRASASQAERCGFESRLPLHAKRKSQDLRFAMKFALRTNEMQLRCMKKLTL